jgi:cell division septation protein DedD
MRNVVDYEEEEKENESEITLNAGTLLGIFFGLVLVCGVFFGFGYSMGRRGTTATPASSAEAAPSSSTQPETPPAAQPANIPKPSAMEALETASPSADTQQPVEEASTDEPKPAPAARPVVVPATVTSKPVLKPAALSAAPASVAGSFMVQIAAVSHQEDANTLANALRQHGYTVSVHNDPPDKLYHVQVGPFASRDAAKQMRSRLLADGYNAILKP